jgi:hypothetical protein
LLLSSREYASLITQNSVFDCSFDIFLALFIRFYIFKFKGVWLHNFMKSFTEEVAKGARLGTLSLVLFYVAEGIGILLNRRYDLFNNAVSELVGSSAPNRTLLIALFAVFIILFTMFSFLYSRRCVSRKSLLGMRLLALSNISGMIMIMYFPVEPPGVPLSINEIYHSFFATIIFIGSMISVLLIGTDKQGLAPSRSFSLYSSATSILIFISLLFMVWSSFNQEFLFGTFERIAIFLFLQWVYVLGIVTVKRKYLHNTKFYFKTAVRISMFIFLFYMAIASFSSQGFFTSF